MNGRERARLNILQALQDFGASLRETAVPTKQVDHVVGDLSRYAPTSNTKILQSLTRDGLIEIDIRTPMKIWMTTQGRTYLLKEERSQ